MKINDIVYSSCGFNSTNLHFYKVVGVTPKSIKLVELKQKKVGHYRGLCLPIDEFKNDTEFVARLNKNNEYIITHHKNFKEWVSLYDGSPIGWDSGFSREDPIFKDGPNYDAERRKYIFEHIEEWDEIMRKSEIEIRESEIAHQERIKEILTKVN